MKRREVLPPTPPSLEDLAMSVQFLVNVWDDEKAAEQSLDALMVCLLPFLSKHGIKPDANARAIVRDAVLSFSDHENGHPVRFLDWLIRSIGTQPENPQNSALQGSAPYQETGWGTFERTQTSCTERLAMEKMDIKNSQESSP